MDEIAEYVAEMVEAGVIKKYTVGGETYIEISCFEDFQTFKSDRPRRQEYPQPEATGTVETPVDSKRKPDGTIVRRKLREGKVSKDKVIHVAAKAASRPKGSRKTKEDDGEPYTREEFIAKMRESNQPHVRWLADYAEERKPKYETKGQWRDYFDRHVKGAAKIRKYSDEQIEKAFLMVEKNRKTRDNPKGYITKWGVETLLKFLDDANQE
jgi:hypothetical protein